MKPIATCWCLCGLSLIGLLLLSAITVVPEGQAVHRALVQEVLAVTVGCAVMAIVLHCYRWRRPDARIFRSRTVDRACFALAVLATCCVLLLCVG